MDKECVAAGSGNCNTGRLRRVTEDVLRFMKGTFRENFFVEIGHFLCSRHYMSEYMNLKSAAKTKANAGIVPQIAHSQDTVQQESQCDNGTIPLQKRPLASDSNPPKRRKRRQAREETLTPLEETLQLRARLSLPGSAFREDLELIDHLRDVDALDYDPKPRTLVATCLNSIFDNIENKLSQEETTGKQKGKNARRGKSAARSETPSADIVLDPILSLPPHLRNKLFARLRTREPVLLTLNFLERFLETDTSPVVNLSNLAIGDRILSRLPQRSSNLRRLCLNNIGNISDKTIARTLQQLTALEIVELRATAAGNLTATAISTHPRAASFKGLNLNYTAVTSKGFIGIAHACTGLEVLKIAGIASVTGAVMKKMLELGSAGGPLPLLKLKKIKIRVTNCDNSGFAALLSRCGHNLHGIDISFTEINSITHITNYLKEEFTVSAADGTLTSTNRSPLCKLDLRGVNPPFRALPKLFQLVRICCPDLTTLLLGKTGRPPSPHAYEELAPCTFENLVRLDFSGGVRRGIRTILQRARRLKILNLSSTEIGVEDLEGLVSSDQHPFVPSVLQELDVSFTRLGDEVAPIIAQCEHLRILNFASTCITAQGVREIVTGCPRLQEFDTSACRRVPPAARSRLFETVKGELAGEQSP